MKHISRKCSGKRKHNCRKSKSCKFNKKSRCVRRSKRKTKSKLKRNFKMKSEEITNWWTLSPKEIGKWINSSIYSKNLNKRSDVRRYSLNQLKDFANFFEIDHSGFNKKEDYYFPLKIAFANEVKEVFNSKFLKNILRKEGPNEVFNEVYGPLRELSILMKIQRDNGMNEFTFDKINIIIPKLKQVKRPRKHVGLPLRRSFGGENINLNRRSNNQPIGRMESRPMSFEDLGKSLDMHTLPPLPPLPPRPPR